MVSSINSRAKGSRGEREFCRWLKENLELNFLPERNLEQTRNGGTDITCIDPFLFEVKRVENLDLQAAWVQVVSCNKKKFNNKREPVVAFRKNGQREWSFLISAKHIGCERGWLLCTEKTFLLWQGRIRHG